MKEQKSLFGDRLILWVLFGWGGAGGLKIMDFLVTVPADTREYKMSAFPFQPLAPQAWLRDCGCFVGSLCLTSEPA
jgi:hypothetical protein